MVMVRFISGLKLSRDFYSDAVKPILDKNFPNLKYSAVLIGSGSEVLGYDTAQSTDHHWGPRLQIFLSIEDFHILKNKISYYLANQLPVKFKGYSTNWNEPDEKGVRQLKEINKGPVNHRVEINCVLDFFNKYIGLNPYEDLSLKDWLLIPEQKLLTITAGEVFYDGLNELKSIREKYSYYPKDVWLYILAAQWDKISQEEAFIGRCSHVGDELGSQIIAARMVTYLMKLCFLMEKKYAPYSKWFGTAFSKLKCSRFLTPIFQNIIFSKSIKEREKYLSQAYKFVAEMHNKLKITKSLETSASKFYGRPYLVIHGENFASAIQAGIIDDEIKKIPLTVGAVDQFADAVSILYGADLSKKLHIVYDK